MESKPRAGAVKLSGLEVPSSSTAGAEPGHCGPEPRRGTGRHSTAFQLCLPLRGFWRLGALLLLLLTGEANAAKPHVFLDSLYVRNDSLLVDFHTIGLFDRKLVRALNRGATSALAYEVELWRSRRMWADALVVSREYRAKVFFNHWEQRYVLAEPDSSAGESLDLEEIMRRCEMRTGTYVVSPVSGLPAGDYYVAVTVVVEPLSVETYQEVRRWLKGEAGSLAEEISERQEQGDSSSKGRLFQLLLDLTGFGDRVYGAKSSRIRLGK